jgi:AcrR family transcriptional regulator
MPKRSATAPAPLIWLQQGPPARQRGLGRDAIVRAAIAVADEGGPQALTMAAVARRLGSYTPMALYRYVSSKDGLTDLMLDHVAGEIALPGQPGPDWRADLRAIALASWDMVMQHTWFAQLVHARPPLGPNMMRRTEIILQILTRQGAPVDEAMTYAALLDRHVFGGALHAAEERAMRERYGIVDMKDMTAAISDLAVADGRYPMLSTWMASPSPVSPDEQLELSLIFLFDGIAAQLPERRSR